MADGPRGVRVSWLSKIAGVFGSQAQAQSEQFVLLQGKMARVSDGELGVLNKMADMGMLRKDVSDASIGTGNFTQGVPAFWFARAVETGGQESLSQPYALSVWVQRAIKKISGPIAGVDVQFSQAGSGVEAGPGGKCPRGCGKSIRSYTKRGLVWKSQEDFIELPAVTTWLRRPMKGLTYSDFVEASIGWLKMRECFWLLSDEMLKPFPEVAETFPPIIVARPDMMREVVEDGEVVGWVFTRPGGKQYSLLPDQVIQLRYWNPYNDFRGLGEYPSAHLAAEADYLAGKFARNLMANNGDLGGVIVAKNGVPTDPQREQIIMDLRAKRAAQLRGDLRYTFLTGDIDIKDPKITSVDAPFITQRLENRHEIALAFGVPPSMFDVKAAYSIGSASDYYQLITDTCIPTGAKFCDALEALVEKLTGQRVEVSLNWDGHPVMQAVLRELFESVDKLWSKGMPMRTIGEYLGMNLPHFAGDDVGFVAINLTPIEQASEPEPPPAQNPALAEGPTEGNEASEGKPEDKEPAEVKSLRKLLGERLHAAHGKAHRTQARQVKNQKLWEQHMRLRSGTSKLYSSKFNKVLNEFRGRTLRKLEAAHGQAKSAGTKSIGKSLIDIIFDAHHFGSELVAAFNPVTNSALQTAADQLRSEVGLTDPWEFPPAKALEFITGRKQSVQNCGETVRNQLNTTLEEGTVNGETMDQLSDRVRTVFNNLSKGEAKRIAMTETGMAFNFSRHEAMAAAGIKWKTWLSSHGPNVRAAHQEAEDRYGEGGETGAIPMDEPFEVGGEELMYPGDPSGSPENIINCQCIQLAVAGPEEEKDQS